MNVLFLDVDGVLNSLHFFDNTLKEREEVRLQDDEVKFWCAMIDRDAVKLLNTIIKKTGVKVVLSSSWRNMHTMEAMRLYLKTQGFEGELIDKTPKRSVTPPYLRGNEIQAWLNEHPEVEKFVIIDDDSDMVHLTPYLVQTSNRDGLKEEHVEQILKVLEK